MRKSVKRAVVIGTTLAVAGVASAAWASWVANGDGFAHAKAVTALPLTTSGAEVVGALYPTGTADAKITINNPNPYAVDVTQVAWDPAQHFVTSTPACGNNGVYFGDFTGGAISAGDSRTVDFYVPAKGSATFTLTAAVHMINSSSDSCQGATFNIPVKLTGESAESKS